MGRTKYIHIDRLQPIDSEVSMRMLAEKDNLPDTLLPEVWYVNDEFILADGHHRTFVQYLRGNQIIEVNYHSHNNLEVGPEVYEDITKKITERAKKVRKRGICAISDLRIS